MADAELRSAIDNPMVLPDGRVESCGNFHGAPVAYACDFLAIAAADVGAIAERRTDRLLDASRSHGLPPFLAADAGIDSGMMLAHYAQAAIVAENRRLAVPASVDSLPTSAMQEDHVSMGWGAARKLRVAVDGLRRVLAVELVCAARGLDLRAPLRPGPGTAAALACCALAGGRARARSVHGARSGGRRGVARVRGAARRGVRGARRAALSCGGGSRHGPGGPGGTFPSGGSARIS